MPSGAGLIRVGSLGGKIIAILSSATQSAPDLLEAFGFRNYTFELLQTDPTGAITGTIDSALSPVGQCAIQFTNDPRTAAGLGTAANWSTAGVMSPGSATPQTQITWDKPAKAFRVNTAAIANVSTGWGSGFFVISATCVP